jgi:hypothetical protein
MHEETFSQITEGGTHMRIVYCFCGRCIEGTTDTELFQRNRDHQNHAHSTHQTTDAQIWAVITANAYEEQEVQYQEQTRSVEANPPRADSVTAVGAALVETVS